MDASQISSPEMLDQLLREGKITDDEYLQLSKSLRHEPVPRQAGMRVRPADSSTEVPWQVWVAIVVCVLASLGAFSMLGRKPMLGLTMIVLNLLLACGLFCRNKWAYVASLVFCFLSVLGLGKSPVSALINFAVGVMLLTVHSYFFDAPANRQ